MGVVVIHRFGLAGFEGQVPEDQGHLLASRIAPQPVLNRMMALGADEKGFRGHLTRSS